MSKKMSLIRGFLAAAFLAVALPYGSSQAEPVAAPAPVRLVEGLDIDAMKEWRQGFHQQPETAFEEVKTAAKVAELLQSWGIETHSNIGKTGVVGVLHGKGAPQAGKKPAICLRADMDALPIKEDADHVPYASKVDGKMHACGHDGHTAMLLGAAKYLSETRNFSGTVYFIFQPAEEKGAGAKAMMEDDLFKKYSCESIFGMHAWPGLPAGTIGVTEGPITSSIDTYKIDIKGKGGHGAYPEKAVNPVPIAAQVISELGAYTPKTADKDAIFGVTNIHAGNGAANVIPESTQMAGTVRTFSEETRGDIETAIVSISKKAAEAKGAKAEIEYKRTGDAVVNAPAQTEIARAAAKEVTDKVTDFSRTRGSEDFSEFTKEVPGAYVALGQAETGRDNAFIHTKGFDFNDKTLGVGASYWVKLVEKALPMPPAPKAPDQPRP